jgi:hypothetical protein
LQVYVTDAARDMKKMEPVSVDEGAARVMLDTQSFTTLVSDP